MEDDKLKKLRELVEDRRRRLIEAGHATPPWHQEQESLSAQAADMTWVIGLIDQALRDDDPVLVAKAEMNIEVFSTEEFEKKYGRPLTSQEVMKHFAAMLAQEGERSDQPLERGNIIRATFTLRP